MNATPRPSCRRHVERPAHWNCPTCQLDLCTGCKPYAELLPVEVNCPLCQGTMTEIRPEVPISQRLQQFALSPAQPITMILMVGLAVILSATWLSWARPLLGLPVLLLVSAWLVMLARHAAEDRPGSPAPHDLLDPDQKKYTLRTFWFSLPVVLILYLTAVLDSVPVFTVGLLIGALVLPLVLIATVAEGRAVKAFDAAGARRIIRVLGRDYLTLAGLTFCALGLLGFGAFLTGVAGAVLALIGAWLVAAVAHHSGCLLHRHRRMLDYPAGFDPVDHLQPPAAEIHEPAQLLADADTLREAGRSKSARLLLGAALTRYPDDLDLNRRFDELIRTSSGRAKFLNHLERRLQRLVHKRQFSGAGDLWQHHSASLDDWMPRSRDTRYRLALELDQRGEHSTAFRMLIGLTPGEPGFNHHAEAWLEAARILDERLGNPPKAGELRKIVVQRYPQQAQRWLARWQAAASGSTRST